MTIGGSNSAASLALAMGLSLTLKPKNVPYRHGWGPNMADAKLVTCTWQVDLLDMNDMPFRVTFDIVEGNEPLVIGDTYLKDSDHLRREKPEKLVIKKQGTAENVVFISYTNPGESRPRMMVVPRDVKSISSMMGTTSADILVKKLHRYSHDNANDMRRLLKLSNQYNPQIEAAIKKVVGECKTCVRSGTPLPSRKVSIKHVNEDFNQTVNVDFFYFKHGIPDVTYVFLHARCTGTGYSEVEVVDRRDMSAAAVAFDRMWISRHGAPRSVGGDPEFDKARFKVLLAQHSIKWKPRPARRHNKVGTVERKNGVIKNIMQRLSIAMPELSVETLAARSCFLSNVFAGSRIASSFEMARGYTPAIAGLRQTVVSPDIVHAQLSRTARRAFQKILSSHKHPTVRKSVLAPGRKIWFFDKDEKWYQVQVKKAEDHFVTCRRKKKGPALKIAYEDIRLAPCNPIDNQLLSSELGGVSDDVDDTDEAEDNTEEPMNDDEVRGDVQPRPALLDNAGEQQPGEVQARNDNAEQVEKDIGDVIVSHDEYTGKLESTKDKALAEVYGVIGHDTVMLRDLEFAPPWLVKEAYDIEEANWQGVYEVVEESSIPKNANVVSSHVAYKIKVSEDGSLILKARICPHGNRDKEKDGIRKDSAAVQFPIIRLMLSLSALMGFRVGTIDISAAYLQSGPIQRLIFVRPPQEHSCKRGTLWKLLKLPYGIAEAGRQWQTACEAWLLSDAVGFERVHGVSQLFVLKNGKGNIRMLCAKVTDDFLISGAKEDIRWFDSQIRTRFKVGKSILDGKMNFNGAVITQSKDGSITLSMEEYMERVKPIDISRERRKQQESPMTEQELEQYRGMSGMLNWAGRAAVPAACFIASDMQQKLASPRVRHLCSANGMLAELKKLAPRILYKAPSKPIVESFLAGFSDAAFNISSAKSYGQSGYVSGVAYRQRDGTRLDLHVTDWNSGKQRRVCNSSYGAEILAAADADDRLHDSRQSIRSLYAQTSMAPIRSALYVDSRGLYDTVSTLHDSKEYRLRQTVQRIRDSFESKDLDALVWIPGTENVADALTKRSTELQQKLSRMTSTGVLPQFPEQCRLDSMNWS